ncbi:hypothetical protein PMAYCL1PPCAC_18160 [Pristionchus mayeri]|uniref:Asparagine synthetase domain-containing protein n=1 Tax=Pristionchus mayeri TaxID=1317129 RepID=A0AAN5CPC9_9BILA|nr:hypothetical protein PMAYCL1PPCAC_18160 [Pristionchus mayeri]
MCDVSYTFSSRRILLNKFTKIRYLEGSEKEAFIGKEHIIQDINKHIFEEVEGDFIDINSDLPGPSLDELNKLSCVEVVFTLMDLKCAWSVIYYNSKLGKVFVGRDIFGRKSLLFSSNSSSITISYLGRPTTSKWYELPYGQVSVIDVNEMFSTLHFCSYLDEYPHGVDREWESLFTTVHRQTSNIKHNLTTVSRLISPSMSTDKLCDHLILAIKSLLPPIIDSVGVCFSGGVDSLLITHLLLSILQSFRPVFLINVAFGDDPLFISRASDRARSIEAYSFLKERFPQHDIHLILVDVSRSSLQSARSLIIPLSTRPSTTVLDESIAAVLHFAFRGEGIDFDTKEKTRCISSLRFMGSGADELFAGYARHRNRYERDGNSSGIAEECETELRRLGWRNGGRDARVALINGVEIKSPFLHDDLVAWANGINMEDKADLSLPRGIGEKKIIRECLRSLNAPCCYPKQAMQFGSGIVKLENVKNQKGSHLSAHLHE